MNQDVYLNRAEKLEARRIIKEKTGYTIKSTVLLNQAFRRSSVAAENGLASNENFEFIGDEVLGYYVTKNISKRVGSLNLTGDFTFRINENRFTQIKQSMVNNESLAKAIDEWGIVKYLRLGRSDIKNNVTSGVKIKADLFEAIIGAIAIDCDWNSKILEQVVAQALDMDAKIDAMITDDPKVKYVDIDNAITTLKEIAEAGHCTMPTYDITPITYPNKRQPFWYCRCRIIDSQTGRTKLVAASSKKDAKKAAAYLILCEHLNMQNQYGSNDRFVSWTYSNGQLTPDRPQNNKEE